MEITAFARNLRMSPRKLRLFAKAFNGMGVLEALSKMSMVVNFARKPMVKLLKSAIANATNNLKMSADSLWIKNIIVDEGAALKRMAKGRKATADRGLVKKKFSHVKLILEDSEQARMTK